MGEKWPCRHPGQCRRRAEGAPGTEQNLPVAQERFLEEQAVPLQLMGTSPHAANEKPTNSALGDESRRMYSPWALYGAHLPMQPQRSPPIVH